MSGAQAGIETEWARIREQFRLVEDRFWFGVIVTEDALGTRVIRERIADTLRIQAKAFFAITVNEPWELHSAVGALDDSLTATNGCWWIEGGGIHGAWKDAWVVFLARLNERRDLLSRSVRGGLLIVGPPGVNELVRDIAPDLWSVRSLVVTLPLQAGPSDPARLGENHQRGVAPWWSSRIPEIFVSPVSDQPVNPSFAASMRRTRRALAVGLMPEALRLALDTVANAFTLRENALATLLLSDAAMADGDQPAALSHAITTTRNRSKSVDGWTPL